MSDNLLYVVMALFIVNILVNMFMIYHICEKVEIINKEVHSSNNYILEKILEKDLKKGGK